MSTRKDVPNQKRQRTTNSQPGSASQLLDTTKIVVDHDGLRPGSRSQLVDTTNTQHDNLRISNTRSSSFNGKDSYAENELENAREALINCYWDIGDPIWTCTECKAKMWGLMEIEGCNDLVDPTNLIVPAANNSPLIPHNSKERIPVCAPNLKPTAGMIFESLVERMQFYKTYGANAGFKMRKSTQRIIDGVVTTKYCVCSKVGESKPRGKVKKRQKTRISCNAKIFLKRNDKENLKVNKGHVQSFRMFKEYVKGYRNVGASLEDFKKFWRDVKQFIKGYDAQMMIENFMHKKAMCNSFYFDFDVDDRGRLSRVIWADPISIKNYSLFGDMTSFDTTFNMNTYKMIFAPFTGVDNHKKCVSFAAELLRNESDDGFAWLFESFLTAMGGKYPKCIITYQDAGIKAGVKKVFKDKTHHRYCMWHIMKKLPDKIGSTLYRETNFMKELFACVWAEDIEPTEFEERWCSVISSYELTEHEWLTSMFDMRASWIPAYFRNLFLGGLMSTTSRSESKNRFFGNFMNPNLTLVEFLMRFESVMDAQRWKQSKLIADSKNSFPNLETPHPLEKHASVFYTPVIFAEFQVEWNAVCFTCGVNVLGVNTSDNILIHDRERNKEQGFEKVPNNYLLGRLSKLALCQPLCGNLPETLNEDCSALEVQKIKLGNLWSELFSSVTIAEQKPECIDELMDLLNSFKDKLILESSPSECSSGVTCEKSRNKNKELEMLLGTKISTEVTVLNPIQSKIKGSGKRLVSQKDKAVQEHKKAPRKCNAYGELGFHDSRNCSRESMKSMKF
ncbi:protein FAR1-RELATED SEQUENCE 5-like [Silene latifolia]|uniref:protein FAR1-RELATED SEQUENCE 5-like n=1 Tax=Silene latifolia TaxID=37657 RepID=UPI003D78732B